ncbi:MAG: prepilin-type N-terminal cleavage/methylation domain-containing protein [Calditrichia bacterium]
MFQQTSDESGYSLMEILVALVLLLIVLIPSGQWMGKHLVDRTDLNKLFALRLAELTMEELILQGEFRSEVKEIEYKNQVFQSTTRIQEIRENLILVTIEVRKGERLLCHLKRSHYLVINSQT